MYRQSSRNQRSKKLKMKHALQLFVLLTISIWLLYQLKHTFDKKNTVDATINTQEENPIANNQIIPEKPAKLGRKDLPQYVGDGNSNRESENEVDEEYEEKDTELDQLLDDVEASENSQEEAEETGDDVDGEYSMNGEDDEEGNIDGDANGDANEMEKAILPSVNASMSVQFDSASNQSGSVNLSIHPDNSTTPAAEVKEVGKSGVQDGLHTIQESLVQGTNETAADTPPYLSTKVEGNRDEIKERLINFS